MSATASAVDAGDALTDALAEIDALRKALAERDAGEVERREAAVEAERARWSRYARHPMGCARDGGRPCDCGLDALRATSPAPEPADGSLPIGEPAPYYLGGRGYRTLDAVRAATDAHAARLGRQCQAIDHEGGVVYVAPAPEPVAADVDAALATIDESISCQFGLTFDGTTIKGCTPDLEDGGTSKKYLDADDCRALAGAFGVVAGALAAARKGGG